jgi:predicted glycosyltransferase
VQITVGALGRVDVLVAVGGGEAGAFLLDDKACVLSRSTSKPIMSGSSPEMSPGWKSANSGKG